MGATPDYGVSDVAGNVLEWTSSLWGKSLAKPDFGYPFNPKDGRENQDVPSESPVPYEAKPLTQEKP